ncbi:Brefeldin A-inhibited guanine nucleotide-exchange protein 2 [Forsythia ovata]|uniref:Brefeldin A-inhibited guanine nucleotide-exchange protein 2 n=1 Tax=Forsythia ovata TaxID=205694 RepID=A0ABD1VIM9_9LAMI
MASPEADSRLKQVLIPALEKIIKNASWRKHSKLATECKSVIEHLTTPNQNPSSPTTQSDPDSSPSHPGVLLREPALDAVQKLIAHGYLHGEADPGGGTDAQLLSKVIESVCKCHDLGEENVELLVIKTLLSAIGDFANSWGFFVASGEDVL